MLQNPTTRGTPGGDLSTVVGHPEHEGARLPRSYRQHRRERLTPQERKALLDALRGSASRRRACDMAGISHNTLEAWIAIAQGKWPERPVTPWHKRLLAEVRQAEASPLVLMQAKAVARGDVRYMMARWPDEFARPDEVAPVVPRHVQESVITIPAERVPEFARFLARADLPEITDPSGRIVDPLAGFRLIEE